MRKYFSLILSIMLVISLVPQNTMAQQTNNVITKENTKISVYENDVTLQLPKAIILKLMKI